MDHNVVLKMDISKKLTLKAALDPKAEWASLLLEAAAHIESLREEIRTQRKEIAGLREEQRIVLENDRPKVDYWDIVK